MAPAIECPFSRLQWNKGHARRIRHVVDHHRHLSSTNHQGCHLLGSGLLISLQRYHQVTNAQRMEGSYTHVPPTTKVPYGLQDRRSPWGLDGSLRMLCSHTRDGRTNDHHEH